MISIVFFGIETWEMPQKLGDLLRGWSVRCLAANPVIQGRETPQEHRHPTINLNAKLSARRRKWAGQILRLELEDSLGHRVLMAAAAMHAYNPTAGNIRRSLTVDAGEYSESTQQQRSG